MKNITARIEEKTKGKPSVFMEERENGETIAHVGKYKFLVLEDFGDTVAVVLKNLIEYNVYFGGDNDLRNSRVLPILRAFAKKIEKIIGEENLVEHTVDLTSEDGLKDYGTIKEKMSLLTLDLFRRYVDVLDIKRMKYGYWLATPHSTARHNGEYWVLCVVPNGYIFTANHYLEPNGVRPYCILKKSIFS